MTIRLARLLGVTMLFGALLQAEQVCDIVRNLKAYDGRELIVTGELLVSKDLAVLGAADCENRYEEPIAGTGPRAVLVWPAALRLRPSASAASRERQKLGHAAAKADQLRRDGKVVTASASVSGRIRLGNAGDLPAEFVFHSIDNVRVEALPDANGLPVISICELFQNLPMWKGKRIAVRGAVVSTLEGSWMTGDCKGAFETNGYRWPVALSYGSPASYSDTTDLLVKAKEPSSAPKGAEAFRRRLSVVRTATYVGRLRMRDEYYAACRDGGSYITNGFGHLNAAAAEIVVE